MGVAAAAGDVLKSTFLLAQTNEVWQWIVTNPQKTRRSGPMGGHADAVAVTTDARVAVIAEGTTGTIWQVGAYAGGAGRPRLRRAVTTLAFAPETTMLVAGHHDGSVTTQSIDVRAEQADERVLTGASGPARRGRRDEPVHRLAVHANGTATVWDLT